MMAERRPPGYFVQQELDARGWSTRALALRMGGRTPQEVDLDQLCVELLIAVDDKNLLLGAETARKLGLAFGVDPQFFLNLDHAWRLDG